MLTVNCDMKWFFVLISHTHVFYESLLEALKYERLRIFRWHFIKELLNCLDNCCILCVLCFSEFSSFWLKTFFLRLRRHHITHFIVTYLCLLVWILINEKSRHCLDCIEMPIRRMEGEEKPLVSVNARA